MYGSQRCPRCGGYRLLRQSARGVVVLCAGCGLTTIEADAPPPPAAAIDAGIWNRERRHQWNTQSPVTMRQLPWMKNQ
jgi:hypothetical protein